MIQATAQYLLITIPIEYKNIYNRLMLAMIDYAEIKLQNCTPECLNKHNNVVQCFNLFHAAVGATNLGNHSLANALIAYIDSTLGMITGNYNNIDFSYNTFNGENNVVIDEENNTITFGEHEYSIQELTIDAYVNNNDELVITSSLSLNDEDELII